LSRSNAVLFLPSAVSDVAACSWTASDRALTCRPAG
jgi:hypothetical protein